MTLFKIYKEICNMLNIDRQYKSSELKLNTIDDRIIISLKCYDAEQFEEELNYVSDIYFKLLNHIDGDIIKERISSFGFHRYHPKTHLDVDMNTILSVIYISKYMNNYDGEQMFLDSLKFLFKRKE